jgi:hypothetical protein
MASVGQFTGLRVRRGGRTEDAFDVVELGGDITRPHHTNHIGAGHDDGALRNPGARLFAFPFLARFLAAGAANPAYAQVRPPTVNLGLTNFEDVFAGPGWLLEEFLEAYIAGRLKDSGGKTVPGLNRVTAYSTTTHVALISRKPSSAGG